METLLKACAVQPVLDHALPFRVMFEEHLRRQKGKLLAQVANFYPTATNTLITLEGLITAQEEAYKALAAVETTIKAGPIGVGPDIEAKFTNLAKQLDTCVAACKTADGDLKKILHGMDSTALCLSGGGIRSASFCLGVMEGLSRFSQPDPPPAPPPSAPPVIPLVCKTSAMHDLDYLSTVSGGGYIGSWLSSWVYRRKEYYGKSWADAYDDVVTALAGHSKVTGGDPEPQPVRHLRSYTSFLAPELGLTLDTFTLGAIVVRNLFANWLMLVPLLIALTALVRCSGATLLTANTWFHCLGTDHPFAIPVVIGSLFVAAAAGAAFGLPSYAAREPKWLAGKVSAAVFLGAVAVGSWLLTAWLPAPSVPPVPCQPFWTKENLTVLILACVGYGFLSRSVWLAYKALHRKHAAEEKIQQKSAEKKSDFLILAWGLFRIGSAGLLSSFTIVALLSALSTKVFPKLWGQGAVQAPAAWAHLHLPEFPAHGPFILFAFPLVLCALMASTSLFCILIGVFEMEEDREWWGRAGGCFLGFSLFWIVAHAVTFYGADGWAALVGTVVGGIGSWIGYSGLTAAGPRPVKAAQLGKVGGFLTRHNLLLPAIGGFAVLLIGMGAARAELTLHDLIHSFTCKGWLQWIASHVRAHLLIFFAAFVLTLILNWVININLFSLAGMYRLRLMRAYLGASNVMRHADPFTNFDPRDTRHEIELAVGSCAPLHVINTTLNLVGTKNPAWRQRKGASFTFNPVVSGGWRVGYVPTECYGGSRGVTLATAMAISGAAADPNMGYQSSPLLSLLMTFFNLRLGMWLPNPKYAKDETEARTFLKEAGPRLSLWPLIQEALGLTDDTNKWIELSDGGHFENLGLYEMVMRRCKHIVVVDAGADPKCQFEDLGNAIRKIQIDLGVPIEFDLNQMKMRAGMKTNNSYCAVGTIHYECADEGLTEGKLVYIKAGITGEEPADIVQYAKTHPTFPHETTADQFFNEAQFESYRHLGSFVVDAITKSATAKRSIADFYKLAEGYWNSKRPITIEPPKIAQVGTPALATWTIL